VRVFEENDNAGKAKFNKFHLR